MRQLADVPNLSAWRCATVGDMSLALNLKAVETSIPDLPTPVPAIQQAIQECAANLAGTTPYAVPTRSLAESPLGLYA